MRYDSSASTARSETANTQLSPLELTIIMIAAQPKEWPLPTPRLARLFWKARYGARVRPLANARLEALRRYAACLHSGRYFDLPTNAEVLFIDAGWHPDDIPIVQAAVRHFGTTPCGVFWSRVTDMQQRGSEGADSAAWHPDCHERREAGAGARRADDKECPCNPGPGLSMPCPGCPSSWRILRPRRSARSGPRCRCRKSRCC